MVGSSTGTAARAYLKREATYNTAASGNYWKIPFISADLGTTQENVKNPVIGHGGDPAAPLRDVLDGKGELVVPLEARNIGLHLAALLGDPVTTDIGTPYQHVFTSNGVGQPTSQSIEIAHLGLNTDQFSLNTGVFYNGMSLSLKRSGFVECKFDVIGTKEVWSGSTGAGTPADLEDSTLKYFSHLTGEVKRNTTAIANLLSGDIKFSNNLDVQEVVANNGYIGGADRAELSLEFSGTLRFKDMTVLNDAINGTPLQLDWALTNSANESITFNVPKLVLARPKVPVSGPGGVDVSVSGIAYGDSSNKLLTVTLVNDHAGTAYAAA